MKKAYLVLANGTVFEGISRGVDGTTVGEIMFTTGMTGYLETVTDASNAGYIVTMTYPIIGNYGVNREDCESDKVQIKGLVVKELATYENNFRCKESFEEFLLQENVIVITGIDTRALTKIIRTEGSMNALITTDEDFSFEKYQDMLLSYKNTEKRTCTGVYTMGEGDIKVALIDYGVKNSIIQSLVKRGVAVTVYPSSTKAEEVLATNPDGIFLSDGPGNPNDYENEIQEVKKLLTSNKPVFGVCLGHQLAALAMGCQVEKMHFGHHGANQPVKDLAQDVTFVSTQNHGYTVKAESLDKTVLEVTHININDGTVEGIRYKNLPVVTVQFYPECKPGAKSTPYILDEFVQKMGGKENA